MKFINFKLFTIILASIFYVPPVRAQSTDKNASTTVGSTSTPSAYNSASADKTNQQMAGVVGLGTGAALAYSSCPNWTSVPLCVIGIGEAVESLMTLAKSSSNTDPSISALQTQCVTNPTSCAGGIPTGGGTTATPSIAATLASLANTPYASDAAALKKAAQAAGVNLNDPGALSSFLGNPAATAPLSDADRAMIEKAKKDAFAKANKYGVSSVGFESASGGGGTKSAGIDKNGGAMDFSGIMDKLDGKKDKSSLNGMQRTLASGEAIGVATDNIFQIVSRRYQSKILAKTFLPPTRR